MNYVAHDCRNCREGKCNNRFIYSDKTRAKTQIPTWAYCSDCCRELGMDFEKQKPSDYRTEEEERRINNLKSSRNAE